MTASGGPRPRRSRLNRRTLLRGAGALAGLGSARFMIGGPLRGGRDGRMEFRVRFAPALRQAPFSGRVYLFFSRGEREPRLVAENWFHPEPVLAMDVRDLHPGDEIVLSPSAAATFKDPADLSTLDLSAFRVQALMRFNPWERTVGVGPGNAVSSAVAVSPSANVLTCDSLIPDRPVPEAPVSRILSVRSPALSEFHGRDVSVRGRVSIPASYGREPERRYPVIFSIPGFGGTCEEGFRRQPVRELNTHGVEFIRVTLDPSCPLGHHVFADSANNGPWGTALVNEFLPALESEYRTLAEPGGRLLTGHSSGGWSSLWLQINWPDVFGGVWSTAPDPVDFRDFQRINLYRPGENMYVDATGRRRPLARAGDRVLLWYDDFCRREDVLGPGGQLHSFEAVFSPRSDDGSPRRLWSRETGAIDAATAAAWTPFDIRLVLEDRWSELASRLAGKLHIHMGTLDTFYLEGATRLLQASLRELGADAVVELHEGADHGSLMSPELRSRIAQEMAERVLRG